ncbi:porin family protein [bacterium]|nr:porin family protein [bacterium]
MKKLLVLGFVLLATSVFAQGFIISPMSGYSMTAFEDQDDAAGNVLLGVEVGMMVMDNLEAGLEVMYPLGYTFKIEGVAETTFKNTQIGAYGKYYFEMDSFTPFVKAGLAYYMGNAEIELEAAGAEDVELELDGALGFSVGGGVLMGNGMFVQLDYNIVSRGDDGDNFGMNTWDVLVGYQFPLGN